MSIPVGVTTVLVSAVPQTTGPIVPGTVTVSVTPTQNLVWSSTGQSLASMCNISPTPGWVQLPAVDQAGFVTPDTRAATVDWAYLVTAAWTQTDGSLHTESGTVQCFSNQQVEYLSGTGGVLTPAAVYPIGGVALGGWVDTYAHLPSTLTAAQAGATYMVQADDLMYVWSGTAWPLSGHGFPIVGPAGPTGPMGPTGPANTLTIGSVTIGTPVSASLSGSSPNQTLNLVLPEARWWTGSGAPGTVAGSVNGDMYLDNTGDGNLYQLQSGVWVGQGSIKGPTGATGATGATGPANSLAIGTVTNGGSAAATITGTSPSQTLNLTLPQGPTGATGPTGPANVQVPTAVKTSAYTAAANDWVVGDATSGAFTVTLPAAPADKTIVIVQKVDSTGNAITVSRGGSSDVFNTSSGPTSIALNVQRATAVLQYAATPAIWYVHYGLDQVVLDARYAQLASPALAGTPTAPTATAGTSTTQIASTAFVATSFAPLASPALSGTPTVPTATAGTNTTQAASTAFVAASFAPLASPTFTGTPAVPTAASGTNTTQAASTAFVQTSALVTGGTTSMNSSQTSAFTAAAGGFYPCSASSAAFTVTLPSAPSSGTRVTIMKTDTTTNAVTVTRGGSDVINVSGNNSLVLGNYLAAATLEYNSGTWYNQESSAPAHFTWLVQSGTRATGYGDLPEGIYIPQALEMMAVQFRIGTADASGSSAAQIYTNTTNASTGSALSGASVSSAGWNTANTHTLVTGPWSIAAGTFLQCDVTSVGTTPGSRLYVDVVGVWL